MSLNSNVVLFAWLYQRDYVTIDVSYIIACQSVHPYTVIIVTIGYLDVVNGVKLGAVNPTSGGLSAFTETVVGINLEVLEAREGTT